MSLFIYNERQVTLIGQASGATTKDFLKNVFPDKNMGIALELVEMQNLSSHPRTTESEAHFNKIPGSFVCTLKFKKYCPKNTGAGEKRKEGTFN